MTPWDWVLQNLVSFRPHRWVLERELANWNVESPRFDPKLRVKRQWHHIDS